MFPQSVEPAQALDLFAPVTLGRLTLPNRFVRAATWEGLAGEDGKVTPELTRLLVRLARGGVGLVITGHAYVLKQGQASPWQLGAHDQSMGPGLAALAEAAHAAGGKIAVQLAHAGRTAVGKLTGIEALGPSDGEGVRAMTGSEIEEAVQAFARAAALCRDCGMDAVEIHAAHGYLLSQFLSPAYNARTDEYGGSLENRARALLNVVRRARLAVGEDFPVLVKINSEDCLPGGLTVDEAAVVASWLGPAGADAVELSGGTGDSGRLGPVRQVRIKSVSDEGYFRQAAARVRAACGLPLILVGGVRSLEASSELVAEGVCDAVSLCRPFIREPELVARWKSGDRRPSACVSDSFCFRPAMAGEGIYCLTEKRRREKAAKSRAAETGKAEG